jgi:diadenosine tetraphosphate (Ap4A) HIT family hydrolase
MGLAHGFAGSVALIPAYAAMHRAPDWRYASQVANETDCELCTGPGGDLLWEDASCRVVRVTDAVAESFPGFCRVVWNRHVAEMSELPPADARHLMEVVFATERALRRMMRPDKINLASLGNVVPHLHWHVIPRWRDDSHFPAPIWGAAQRNPGMRPPPEAAMLRSSLETELSPLSRMP